MQNEKLIHRLNRITGQIEGIKRKLESEEDADCVQTLQQLKASINGLKKFGEAYIRVTEAIKKLKPGFFPARDYKFQLKLPNGKTVSAKICQDGDKALMSDPNIDLCTWLYELIDIDLKISHKRYAEKNPYRYSDLELIGKDSVKVIKKDNDLFEMAMMPIGSYEKFINDDDFVDDDEYEAD